MKLRLRWIISTTWTLIMICGETHAQAKADLNLVARNFAESIVTQDGGVDLITKVDDIASSETNEGSWRDIDYKSKAEMDWPLRNHLNRMEVLAAAAYAARDAGRPDPKLEAKALLALSFWLRQDFHNSNWWWGKLWVPLEIGKTAMLLQSILTPQDRQAAARIMGRSDRGSYTGENLIWGCQIEILIGILQNDRTVVSNAFRRLFAGVGSAEDYPPNGLPGEGIMRDASFHQHGALLYSGGYGLTFAQDVIQMILIAWNTPYRVPIDTLKVFVGFLLDGDQWMIRGKTFDYATVGREIAWPDIPGVGPCSVFQQRIQQLASRPIPRQQEMKNFANRLNSEENVAPLNGDRYFWNSDYLVSRRSSYLASLRMFSTRTRNSELVGGQGLRSVHLADGMNLLYKTGDEYAGIFPVWDWTLVPGTTAIHASLPNGVPQSFEVNNIMQSGASPFVGAVTDGTSSAAAMDLRRGPLQARKAWFFFKDFYLCLGAGIRAVGPKASDDNIATDVNQTLARGTVQVGPRVQTVSGSRRGVSDKSTSFVLHDEVGYLLWPGSHFVVSNSLQVGDWSAIGTGSKSPVSRPVFNLWIDHGSRPSNSTYAYAVFPNVNLKTMTTIASAPPLSVIANTESQQAVYNSSAHLVSLIYYKAGVVHTPLGDVEVDKPSMVLVQQSANHLTVTASEPTHQTITLHISVGARSGTAQLLDGRSTAVHLR